jgi:hypothetical protein
VWVDHRLVETGGHQAATSARTIGEASGEDARAAGGFEHAHAAGDDRALGEIVGSSPLTPVAPARRRDHPRRILA